MADTKIEWATVVWNPLRGCSKVSAGCTNCYAVRQAHRFSGPGEPFEGLTCTTEQGPQWTGKVILLPEKLKEPLTWRKPQRVFVNSMSDLFHQEVPQPFIDKVLAVAALAPRHTFMVLTKRPKRMLDYMLGLEKRGSRDALATAAEELTGDQDAGIFVSNRLLAGATKSPGWPLKNLWLGVSVEDQWAADNRIPLLLQTPAAVRFISCEPLLGPLDLEWPEGSNKEEYCCNGRECGCYGMPTSPPLLHEIDWVIAGGESGPGARPMHPEWVRSLRDQCQRWKVPFHFKQWGEYREANPEDSVGMLPNRIVSDKTMNLSVFKFGKSKAGRELDGRTWDEFPVKID